MKRKYFVVVVLLIIASVVGLFIFINSKRFQNKAYDYKLPITNSWYSSLFFDKFSKALFALPLSFNLTADSFEISKTDPIFNDKSITSGHSPELFLKFADNSKFVDKQVVTTGEWDVRFVAKGQGQNNVTFHVIKGSPVLYFRNKDSKINLSGEITNIKKTNSSYVIKTKRNDFYLFKSDNTLVVQENTISIGSGSGLSTLTLLPDEMKSIDDSSLISIVNSCTKSDPKYTTFYISQTNSQNINVDFYFDNKLNFQSNYLLTIWPNQKSRDSQKILGTYTSVKGGLELVCSSHLSTSLEIQDLPTSWDSLFDKSKINTSKSIDLLNDDLATFEKFPVPTGVYFKGKYLKNLTDLWEIATFLGNKSLADNLFGSLKDQLIRSVDDFNFSQDTQGLMAKNPEFGNEKGNDHNLQYGYYIYSFAKIYPYLSTSEKTKIETLMSYFVKEGIPGIVSGSDYPRQIRFLDEYESHSWADGQAVFDDGNNQESSSEALFYWYSLYLWSTKTNNANLGLWSKFAYFAELNGRNTYWFLSNNPIVSQKFVKPIISLVWGDKADYATWFSPEEDQILGIQLLPINPSSLISLRLDEPTKTRILGYYDKVLGNSPLSQVFGGYYVFLKKINGIQNLPTPKTFNNEFFSQALFHLLL